MMEHAHLTSIRVEGRNAIASCDCGWSYRSEKLGTLIDRKKDAKAAALDHWASSPAPYSGGDRIEA